MVEETRKQGCEVRGILLILLVKFRIESTIGRDELFWRLLFHLVSDHYFTSLSGLSIFLRFTVT